MNSLCSVGMTGKARGKPSLDFLVWGVPVCAQLQERSAGPLVAVLGLLCVPSPAVLPQPGSSSLSNPLSCSFCLSCL